MREMIVGRVGLAAAMLLGLSACGDELTFISGGLVETTAIAAGAQCPTGGVRVDSGNDQNSDGVLTAAEITSSEIICNGVDGSDGADGADGADGSDGVDRVDPGVFKLQLLHFADVDGPGGADDVRNFSAMVDGFRGMMPQNTLLLSSGDNWIPGPEYFGADDARLDAALGAADAGRAHVGWLNALGVQASVVGNHELDLGADTFAELIAADGDWPGAQFPYLSANIDFSADADTAPLLVAAGQAAAPNSVSSSATITVGGQTIGVVGASSPTFPSITSVGDLEFTPDDSSDIDALAAIIQAEVDALTAGGNIDKVILLAHMQQISVEKQLAELLSGVDIIIAGGSNTRLADLSDRLREGDAAADVYPQEITSASGEPVLLVNTDGDYRYLGRLVVDFDAQGRVLPQSIDPIQSGAFATDVLPFASFEPIPEVVAITEALEEVLVEKDGNVLGLTSVFLDGRRSQVRTEETNVGNLTAEANLWYAQQTESDVLISLKNGGGIRAEIGQVLQPPGTTDPAQAQFLAPQANVSSGKPAGGISQLDLEQTLRFNNRLVNITVTVAELADIIEHAVAGDGTPGQFPQVAGVRFSFDPSMPARTAGDTNRGAATTLSRVLDLAIVDDSGAVIDQVAVNGMLQGDLSRSYRLVTLNFLAENCINDPTNDCGDGYPYKGLAAPNMTSLSRIDTVVDPGQSSFSDAGREQDALAEYLQAFFAEVPYDLAETDPADDLRIQRLVDGRSSSVFALPTKASLTVLGRYQNPNAGFDESAAEIVAFDPATDRLFVINAEAGQVEVLDISNPATPTQEAVLDPVAEIGAGFDGVNSVVVAGGVVAVAVEADPATANGRVALYDAGTLAFVTSLEAGALPDGLAASPDGGLVAVANEGEVPADPNDGDLRDFANDVPGSITMIDLSNGAANATAMTLGFTDFNMGGSRHAELPDTLRIEPGATSVANDLEPEYPAFSEDGSLVFVSLQENNGIAVVDVENMRIDSIVSLGFKDHGLLVNALDVSDRDEIDIVAEEGVWGLAMPDGIASYMVNGTHYVVTANEGDSRDDVDECGLDDFANLDATLFAGRDDDNELGRIDFICDQAFDLDNDGDIDRVTAFGARSFSVVDENGVVFDSNDDFERITAHLDLIDGSVVFNASNDNATRQNRSDNKGPEPENVDIARIGDRVYGFIGLERVGGIMIYDLTNPRLARFLGYTNNRDFSVDQEGGMAGDLGPEGVLYIPAADSPSGADLLVTGNEINGSTTIFTLNLP